jgi:hypothetical protein
MGAFRTIEGRVLADGLLSVHCTLRKNRACRVCPLVADFVAKAAVRVPAA